MLSKAVREMVRYNFIEQIIQYSSYRLYSQELF